MNEHIWDPLRRKNVALTPEERVRQWFIQFLINEAGVPVHQMTSEAGLKFGEKTYRADILIYSKGIEPLAIVECKNPTVELNSQVLDQALRYNMVLNVKYIIITNGKKTVVLAKDCESGTYTALKTFPKYSEMTL